MDTRAIDAALAQKVKVVTPGHPEWETRRARWNHFSKTAPTRIIAVPQNVDDVVAIVDWARENEQTSIGARAGGHSYFSTNEVVIDMRDGFGYTTLDEATGIATIGMGQTLASVDEQTAPWHVPLGVVSHTGTGLMLTGGVGYLCKAHGASGDAIREITIVTSDGKVHVCSADHEPDLFFAVRGAAPNLGIVTEVKAQAYKHPDALCTLRVWPSTEENMQRLFDWADQPAVLDDVNITPYIALIPAPDLSTQLVAIHIVCVGPAEDDERVKALIGQLDDTGETALLPTSRVPFSVPQTIFDSTFPEQYWYVTQTYYPGDVPVPAASLRDTREAHADVPLGPIIPIVIFEQRGSKSARYHQVPSDDCAQPRFGQRWECYVFFGTAEESAAEDARRLGREVRDAVLKSQDATKGGRCHFTTDEPSRIEFYYGPNSKRVRDIVAKYDPHRLFAYCNGMEF